MKLTRFERKILAAIAAVAVMPLVGSLVLGRVALRDTYDVGVNPRVESQLDNALEIYRAHFVALRDDAERTADAVAYDHRLHRAVADGDAEALATVLDEDLERYPNVAAIQVRRGGRDLAERRDASRSDPETMRLLAQVRALEDLEGRPEVEVTIATAAEPFFEYQRAGEVAEVYGRLAEGSDYVSGYYLAVYIAFLLSVIVVAMAMGIVLSRRVTRRVADLAEATARVGAGDLSVQVPSEANDEVGELTRAFNAMVRDIRESRERIEYLQRIGAWQEFARRLAHEIKNPLTPIQLAAQEMHMGYDGADPEFHRKLLDARAIIEEEVATLRRLVSEFSSFAKLPQAELAPADLRDFVGEIDRSLAAIPEGESLEEEDPPEVSIDCETGEEAIPVRIDAMMLKRCVDNLVRNAVQAVRGAGAGGAVRVWAEKRGGGAVLEISDDGPGVPREARARVFDPYYTTRSEGTGLGLAIVKKVVLEHGGEIECDEAEEGGALFRIHLPLFEEGR